MIRTIYFEDLDYTMEIDDTNEIKDSIITLYSDLERIDYKEAEAILNDGDLYEEIEAEYGDLLDEYLIEKFHDQAEYEKNDNEEFLKNPDFYYGV